MSVLSGYDIFISYARQDAAGYARKLYEFLTSLDFTCFFDREEAPGGAPLQRTLKTALRQSKILIIVASEAAFCSKHVPPELAIFAETGRPIVPISIAGILDVRSTQEAPWSIIRKRDIIWLDDTPEALRSGMPSPAVYEGIQKRFHYTRRNVVRRRWATVLLSATLIAAATATWQAFAAKQQESIAKQQEGIAAARTADLREQARELDARTRDLTNSQQDLSKSNDALQKESNSLTKANSALLLERSRLELKTLEATDNAKRAKEQEDIAVRNAKNADTRQQAAEALAAANRAQREFETDPLRGLSTALAALQSCPSSEETAKASVDRVARSLLAAGRVGHVEPGDFVKPFFIHDANFFVLQRRGKPAQIVDTATGQVRVVLDDEEVVNVRNAGDGVYTQDDARSLPYFIVEYQGGQKELRRRRDGSLVLRGRIQAVGYNYSRSDDYFQISSEKGQLEFRRLDNDQVAVPPHTVHRIDNAPYSLFTYANRPAELRRSSDGQVLETIDGTVSAPSFEESFHFSKDRSLYAITFEPVNNEFETKLYRTNRRVRVKLTGPARFVIFDPGSTAYVVVYKDLPGELRYSDSSIVVPMSDIVHEAAFDSVTGEFMLAYATRPCESRRHDGSVLKTLGSKCESLSVFGQPPLFRVRYSMNLYGLFRDGTELGTYWSDSLEAEPDLLSKSKFFTTDYRDVRRYSDGRKVAIEGFPDSAGEFVKGTRFIILRCESQQAPEGPPKITAPTGSRSRLVLPPPQPASLLRLPYGVGGSDCKPPKIALLDILSERTLVTPGDLRVAQVSPAMSYVALEDLKELHYLVNTVGNAMATPIPAGSTYFSPNDEHLFLHRDKTWYSIKLPEGSTTSTWTSPYASGRFSPDSKLFFLEGNKSGEIRLATGKLILGNISNVEFSETGNWFIAELPSGRREIWAGEDNPHRLTDLGLGVTGVHVDDARERAFVWYQDRQAYFIDLRWLEVVNALPQNAPPDVVIEAGCYPFRKAPLRITAQYPPCR